MSFETEHLKEIAGYRLTQRLGSGGMGDVYKAYNEALNRTAAIKILHQKEMGDRFRNEAYIQSSVSHPNIARLYEYLVSGDMACIIMEYVEGDRLDEYRRKKGSLSNAEIEDIVKQIAGALAYLHGKDILHRDIKPQNFKVQPNGTVTMLDFGISKNKYTPKLTQQGYMVGTTEYMAPEQFREQVEKKSDMWSLGVLAYELITGYMPFEATNAVTMRAKIEKGDFTKPNILVPAVSDKLSGIIEKCLQINPAKRIAASAVESMFSEKKMKPAAGLTLRNMLPFQVTNKMLMIAAGLVLLIIVAIAIPKGPDEPPVNPDPEIVVPEKEQTVNSQKSLTIGVLNAADARIIFPDGSSEKLPYDIKGNEGEMFKFRLEAEGYKPRDVEVPLSSSRNSYEYNLEKIKE